MTKKIKLLVDNKIIEQTLLNYFENRNIAVVNSEDYDLLVLFGNKNFSNAGKVVNIQPSLLPAFSSSEAIKESFLFGVKVSGVTIHYVEKDNFYGKIIAQYPIFIGNNTHFDEFEQEIIQLCAKFAPQVIETVLEDKVFDFSQSSRQSCSTSCNKKGGCGGCKGCHN